jgi:hypothetical protein
MEREAMKDTAQFLTINILGDGRARIVLEELSGTEATRRFGRARAFPESAVAAIRAANGGWIAADSDTHFASIDDWLKHLRGFGHPALEAAAENRILVKH